MHNLDTGYFSFTRSELLPFVPLGVKKTLDVGCGAGVFSAALKDRRQVEAWGVEMSAPAAEVASGQLDKVLCGTFEDAYGQLPQGYFDCIFFNDVLEHMVDPYSALRMAATLLTKNGVLICSIPNIRYFPQLVELLIWRDWKYKDAGILDRTHLRFFTIKSIKRMFAENGMQLLNISGINPIGSRKYRYLCHAANIVTLGLFRDCYHQQYACVVKITR